MNRFPRLLLSACLFGGLALAPVAFAQQQPTMATADAQGNAIVPTDDHALTAEAMFGKADANGDGKLSGEELKTARKTMAPKDSKAPKPCDAVATDCAGEEEPAQAPVNRN